MRTKSPVVLALAVALGLGTISAGSAVASDSPHVGADWVKHAPAKQLPGQTAKSGVDRTQAESAPTPWRIFGQTRYATSVEVSKATFPDGTFPDGTPVPMVFIASGDNYPDALAAGPLASGLGPLLLVPHTGTLPAEVKGEITRLAPSDIVIMGGASAVDASIEAQLSALGATVSRVAGQTRYETAGIAAEITDQIWRNSPPENSGLNTLFIANGLGFADALAGGGAAAANKGALLLTAPTALPPETAQAIQDIGAPTIYVLGGTGAVSDAVLNQIKSVAGAGTTVTRVSGVSRYDTAVALSKVAFPNGALNTFLVNGLSFPDALAVAPLAGWSNSSTLLSGGKCVTAPTATEVGRLGSTDITGVGGPLVLSDDALNLTVC